MGWRSALQPTNPATRVKSGLIRVRFLHSGPFSNLLVIALAIGGRSH